jgi:glycerol-3-phosphate acyltransferase PlsY
MTPALKGGLCILGAYLLGSVCFGVLVANRRGVDLRAVGSGNVGATNVGRALGRRTGALVLVLDALKGLAATAGTRAMVGDADLAAVAVVAGAGLAATVGHVLPIWHRFRGGKGVATALGATLGTAPAVALGAALVFAVTRWLSKTASLASLVAVFAAALAAVVWFSVSDPRAWMLGAFAILLAITHRANIGRLRRGEEFAA